MEPGVRGLAAFYDTPLGLVARRAIMRRARDYWPDVTGTRLLGYGFAMPYLRGFAGAAERVVAAMPANMGVIAWPPGKCATLLCEEDALPFADVFFDRILIVHGLEGAESLRRLLRQVWRVLAPEGKVLIVAPNRASLWSQLERSPFGHGRPFSRGELGRLLREALFEPGRWTHALYAPPLKHRALVRSGLGWERVGARLFPGIGGVHMVEAGKSLYAPAPVPAKNARAGRLKAVSSDV
jgi:SAM-dependent methyltransferase